MKKFIVLAIIAISTVAYCDDSEYAIVIPTNTSVVIAAPAYKPSTWQAWTASTAVTNGVNLRSGTDYFMVLTTGTTDTNAPTKAAGVITDGTAELLYIQQTGRKKLIVTQEANAEIWYHTGTSATTNGGEFAYLKGQQYSSDANGPVSVFSPDGVRLNIITK